MTTQTTSPKNGVPVDQLVETMRVIRQQPEIARFRFSARNGWQNGGFNVATINAYHGACEDHGRAKDFTVAMDEPPILLSGDEAPNPVEVLLSALSGCLTTSLVYHAAAMGIEVTAVESTYSGDIDLHGFLGMDEKIRNGFQSIRVAFKVESPDATDEQLDDLVRIARERSPVFDVVRNGTPIEVTRS